MKKHMMTLAAVLMAGAAVTSCSSDNEMDSLKAPAGKTYTMTVQATKGGDETRALSLSGEGDKTLNATWATTENVYVKKVSDWATGSLQPQANGATATLKGTLSGVTIAANDVLTLQFPKSGDITYAGQKGTLEDIAANFDWATATPTVASVEDGKITVNGNVTFVNQQAVVKFTLKNGDDALSATKLVVAVGSTEYEVNPESAASEIYVAIPGFSGQTITLTATVGSDTYTYEKSGVTFANGKYYRVAVKMTKQAAVPAGALSGEFSVSATKKVKFSKGNLQAKIASYASHSATASEWKFADSQDSYIGNAAGNTSFAADTWVDLFSWVGNSATNDTYGLITFTSNSQANHGNVSGESLKTDWGTAAASSIGTGWRTLSSAEWNHLFTGRANATTLRTLATVNGKQGLIIMPDGWTASGVSLTVTIANYTTNNINTTDWVTLESQGCVFLPAAGGRNGASVINGGSGGYYWSSTANDTGKAYDVYFGSGSVDPASSSLRGYGFSVRLVRDVAAPAPAPEEDFVTFSDGTNTVKVATKNLGATTVAESAATSYGDYYAWGATETFGTVSYTAYNAGTVTATTGHEGGYTQANAPYYSGSAYTKYTVSSVTTLEAADDAVAANMSGWHMPTQAELQTLFNACGGTGEMMSTSSISNGAAYAKGMYWVAGATSAVTIGGDTYSVNGVLFVQDATHHVFFPAAGKVNGTDLNAGSGGYYWSSSLYTDDPDYNNHACYLNFPSFLVNPGGRFDRYNGFPVRPFKD